MFIPVEKCKSGHKNRDSAESVRPAEHRDAVLVGEVLPDIAENRGRRAADDRLNITKAFVSGFGLDDSTADSTR